MTPRLRIALAMVVAGGLLLAGCSTTTRGSGTEAGPGGFAEGSPSSADFGSSAAPSSGGAGAGARTTAQLQGNLVAATDLGTGWMTDPDDSDDGDDSSDDCGSDVDLPQANQADIDLDNDETAEFFTEELDSTASESAAKAAVTAIMATFTACSGQPDSDGSVLTLTPTDFPKLGDDSTAFTATATSNGISLAGDLAVIRDGSLVEFFFLLYQADSPAPGFTDYVTAGVTKAHSLR